MIFNSILVALPFAFGIGLVARALFGLRTPTKPTAKPVETPETDWVVEAARLGLPWDAFPWEVEAAKAEREAETKRAIQAQIEEAQRLEPEDSTVYRVRNMAGDVVYAYATGPRQRVDTNGDGLPDDRYPPDGQRRHGRSWRETQALFDESARAAEYEVGS